MIFGGHEIKNFSEDEFPDSELEFADPNLIYRLQRQRDVLGSAIYPSKANGALARFEIDDIKSKHCATGRKSTAIDWFTYLPAFETWNLILSSDLWQGHGICFDTKNNSGEYQPMFHTDFGRECKAFWFRNEFGVYVTQNTDSAFWGKLLGEFLGYLH